MSSQYQPKVVSMFKFKQNQDLVTKEIDEVQKCKNKTLVSRKRSGTHQNEIREIQIVKKAKFDCKKIPNELWLKIMNYSNTKDLIKNLAVVCKNFNSLAKDVAYLELKDITKYKYESAMKLLKTTKHLKEISLSTKFKHENNKPLNHLLFQALKSSKSIKSIKLLPFHNRGHPGLEKEIWSKTTFSTFKKIQTHCKGLEHLYIKDVAFTTYKVVSQIAQITTLKSFKLDSYNMNGKFNPENILEFSRNCPNLEAIRFFIKISHQNINQMKHAFDTFLEAKKQTLKSFGVNKEYQKPTIDRTINESSLLENLHLCQNLEELEVEDFKLQHSTFVDIMNLPKLKTLVLQTRSTSRKLFLGFSHSQALTFKNLKHLKLTYIFNEEITLGFAKIKFPVLERLALDVNNFYIKYHGQEDNITYNALCQLIANSPSLKSIQLIGKHFHNETYRNMSLQFCKERNIFIAFSVFTYEKRLFKSFKRYQEFQNGFENDLTHKEPMIKTKYEELRRHFSSWEKMNDWWSYAIRNTSNY